MLILDSVTTSAGTLDKLFTLTVKGNCVFQHQVNFLGKTQLQGGTFQRGINAALGERPWPCWTDMPLQTLIATKF